MAESEIKSSSVGNVVKGFSDRFNALLDRAGFPKQNRLTVGAKRFGIVPNTFRSWCVQDKIPQTHSDLVGIVEKLLKDVPGRYNARAVVAWLLAGDAVPHPFTDEADALLLVELYFRIREIAKSEKIEFEKLPRDVRNLILKRVRAMLPPTAASADEGLQLDHAVVNAIAGMLETARAMHVMKRR